MTATIDYQMPKIVQVRRREDFAVGSCDFPKFDLSIEELLKKAEERKKKTSEEIPSFYKQDVVNSSQKVEGVVLPDTYLTNGLLSEKTAVFPNLQSDQEEIEEAFLRGVQPTNHRHKILFTQKVELKTSELKRRRPNIVINPILFEDDE